MSRGRFITLEGGEGAGKSTQARAVRRWLESRGRSVVSTREPGGSPLAEAIRGLVLAEWAEGMDATTELLLMFAARAAHLRATIEPALAAGQDVVCDRFVDASWAYQGAGRQMGDAPLASLEQLVLRGLEPDLTLVFDLPVALGLQRAQARGDANRFEGENRAFMERVREAYRRRAAARPARYAVIDAAQGIEAVSAQVEAALEHRWGSA
jgi:dTMP kinase